MADIDYPLSLPGVLLSRYSLSDNKHFESNDFNEGPPINQLLTSLTYSEVNASWSFNAVEYQAFDAWFRYVINLGATPFNMLLPTNDTLELYECQFSGKVNKSLNGKRNHVSALLFTNKVAQ